MGKRVLIVDDSAYLRLMIKKVLTQAGYQVVGEASDGEQAIQLYKELRPDLVTMDVVMPKKNGLEALQEIFNIDPNACVVIITALGHEPLIKRAIRLGAKNFVIKPFKPNELVKSIESALAS